MNKEKLMCSCGCKTMDLDQRLVPALEALEKAIGYELNILSGCRCKKHNADEGGAEKSKHLPKCSGVDIESWAKNKEKREKLIAEAKKLGFIGFGFGHSFLHIDFGPQRVWFYPPPLKKHPAVIALEKLSNSKDVSNIA